MKSTIIIKSFNEPPFCEKEILRYAGCKIPSDDVTMLMKKCIEEARDKISYKLCFRLLPVRIKDSFCDFNFLSLESKNLAENLAGCSEAIVFSATIGIGIDRLITKYSKISPSKALMMQAIGAERIEALCDSFVNDLKKEKNMKPMPRFSPGYGDLPLSVQKDIFYVLDCPKNIGLTLNDSLLMSPTKSVTAFIGLYDT